ncbi:hypothetical protein B0H34DRAFT_399641 [Crassisporium funariophilum]|nr:hypothetical protein B0H34DRAFT_399641 [Crassisporium funariophilum]
MTQRSPHTVAPSLNDGSQSDYSGYGATGVAQPPSHALAAASAASAAAAAVVLQERPKYVYGQDAQGQQQQMHDDEASEMAHGGAYSSQPQMQNAYNAEAYGSYAKYEDVGGDVVGGGPSGGAGYQEAQREYQGQQGYDAQAQGVCFVRPAAAAGIRV